MLVAIGIAPAGRLLPHQFAKNVTQILFQIPVSAKVILGLS